jgi:hypothetical protein
MAHFMKILNPKMIIKINIFTAQETSLWHKFLKISAKKLRYMVPMHSHSQPHRGGKTSDHIAYFGFEVRTKVTMKSFIFWTKMSVDFHRRT